MHVHFLRYTIQLVRGQNFQILNFFVCLLFTNIKKYLISPSRATKYISIEQLCKDSVVKYSILQRIQGGGRKEIPGCGGLEGRSRHSYNTVLHCNSIVRHSNSSVHHCNSTILQCTDLHSFDPLVLGCRVRQLQASWSG